VLDMDNTFKDKCNMDMVELDTLDDYDKEVIHNLLASHIKYTGSTFADKVLNEFGALQKNFVKVMPLEYKRILEQRKLEEKMGIAESQ
ncbi:hypothetical protein KKC59_00185, partial [bacterium]|nr:hypothetical protein [bacterium]